jgi:thymidylate synthase
MPLSELKIPDSVNTLEDIEKLEWSDFELLDYKSHLAIKAPVAV